MDEKLVAEIPNMVELIKGLVDLVGYCSVSTGVCYCGDDMDKHTMYSGHSPVDQGTDAAFVLHEKSIALLKRIGEYAGEEPQ